jgi:hypothetical protein
MARGLWVWRNGKLIPKGETEVEVRTTIINDEMPSTVHPANGQRFTSKRKFREMTRAAGCVEVGDQKFDTPKPKEIGGEREALISTWNQLSERRK